MHAIFLVLLLGTSVNVANDHPQNMADVNASIVRQITQPVIQPGGNYNR